VLKNVLVFWLGSLMVIFPLTHIQTLLRRAKQRQMLVHREPFEL